MPPLIEIYDEECSQEERSEDEPSLQLYLISSSPAACSHDLMVLMGDSVTTVQGSHWDTVITPNIKTGISTSTTSPTPSTSQPDFPTVQQDFYKRGLEGEPEGDIHVIYC